MKKLARTYLAVTMVAGIVVAATHAAAGPRQRPNPLAGEGEGLKLIANIPWTSGTDMELTTIKGRDYAFADSRAPAAEGGGLHVIDITKPDKPKEVGYLPCTVSQGDIQISHDQKTVIMAADGGGGPDSCLMVGKLGFMTVDISNPRKPKAIGVAEIPRGSHNTTAHPTKPYVYNSDSDLGQRGEIQIWSIKNPAKPELVNTVPSLPHSPHDISFNKKGTLAVTASVSHFDIWNTEDPANPTLVWTGQCPGCSITHDAKFTPDGSHIFIGDEGGGGATYPCPGGALYAYLLEGTETQPVPVLVGAYEPDEFVATSEGPGGCTSHVFDISDDSKKIAISWYTAGTRYLDVSNPHGFTVGGNGAGIVELGWFIPEGGDSWSSKFHPRNENYIYSNDILRGFDAYKIVTE
ncbi:MAG: LVIVD repeat-containing protein [Actinomycetota bacterium]